MSVAKIRKAIATFYGTLPSAVATLGALGFLDGNAQKWVIGLAGALVAPLTYLGVYQAKANAPS